MAAHLGRSYQVIHIGAHGAVDPERPAHGRTFLVDAPEGEAEVLSAAEMDPAEALAHAQDHPATTPTTPTTPPWAAWVLTGG